MKQCGICGASWGGDASVCPLDGGELVTRTDPLLGRCIGGRYVITAHIGSGGMATVYRARHEIVGRDVAIKFLAPGLAVDETNRRRFLREAKAANRIDHPHIIDITDYGETDDGLVYLVMEYLAGEPLSAIIARGPLPPERALAIAMQMAAALARAQELDVVHRDIKPDNVHVLPRRGGGDFVKLIDFGLAKMRGEIRLTAKGAMFGTPEYLAPEQARGAPATGKADLYALGCVLFEMIRGEPPFAGTVIDLVFQHMNRPAPSLRTNQPHLPKELDALVARLLAKDPADRHRDGYHVLDELRAIAARLPRGGLRSSAPEMEAPTVGRDEEGEGAITRTLSAGPALWKKRVGRFRELAGRVHPREAPPWLVEALAELEADAAAVEREHDARSQTAAEAQRHEEETRALRLQLGRAIDVLGQDESRALGALEELGARIDEERGRSAERAASLRARYGALPASAELTPALAEALRDAGRAAEAWLDSQRAEQALAEEVVRREHERDDLRFQIAQMKGRLATLSVEMDLTLSDLRERTQAHDLAVQRRLDALAQRARPVVEHLATFPAIADALRAVE